MRCSGIWCWPGSSSRPASKDSLRVLSETGVDPVDYRTVTRRLPVIAKPAVRQALSAACAARAGLGPASLVLYDVSTLYFETDTGDGFREPGFSKERRLEPQITIGLLTDATGFPLAVEAFEGNKAETATMLPVINAFKAAHQLDRRHRGRRCGHDLRGQSGRPAGGGFVVHPRHPHPVRAGCGRAIGAQAHPGQDIPDGQVFTQPWPATSSEKARGLPDLVVYYQYRHDRARRTLRGIDEQVAKAEKAVDGNAPVKRNQFIKLTGCDQECQSRFGGQSPRAGRLEGLHHQSHRADGPEFVIDAYHQLWRIEKSFRMFKHDLQARPVDHHKRESIDAHLTIVFAALAVSHWIEHQTGWSIKKFVRTARRYRTVKIQAGKQTLTAADRLTP